MCLGMFMLIIRGLYFGVLEIAYFLRGMELICTCRIVHCPETQVKKAQTIVSPVGFVAVSVAKKI